MEMDPRYKTVRILLTEGHIKNLSQLLEEADKTPLARDIKTSPERFNKLIENPALFMLGDIYSMARVIGVEEKKIFEIVHAEWLNLKK